MPSATLLRFIERALQDDKFFEAAIESPLEALKESGVRLDLARLSPSDLATFFGALAAVKQLAKKRQLREVSFEAIFGQAAEIPNATLARETQRGMWTQFQRSAFVEREMCATVNTRFETAREALAESHLSAAALRDQRLGLLIHTRLQADLGGIGTSAQSSESSTGVSFHFDATRGMGSSTSSHSDTYSDKNFAGISVLEDLLNGPLISPADLLALAAQLDTYVTIAEQAEGF